MTVIEDTRAGSAEIDHALRLLDKRRVVLSIHDASFPSADDEDVGRGTPYGSGGHALIRFARQLGFNGIQLGPQGQTSRGNPSPYDATTMSRNVLSLALGPLARDPAWAGLLDERALRAVIAGAPGDRRRVPYGYVYHTMRGVLGAVHERFVALRERGAHAAAAFAADFDAFVARSAPWLEADALYDALASEQGGAGPEGWPAGGDAALDPVLWAPPPGQDAAAARRRAALGARHAGAIERYQLGQWLLARQHAELRRLVRGLGMSLYGDLQVGLSPADVWRWRAQLLPDYLLGAPPSRTNPEGQPWGYALLDPDRCRDPDGPARALFRARLHKMFDEYDAVRIDHPHGLVCPWVYRAGAADPTAAVRAGARLHESPDLDDHPALARHAIARADQLDPRRPRHADDRVARLEPAQVARYGALIEEVLAAARAHGRSTSDVLCEVLSTQPYPLARVMAEHGLGRFRVTQKALLDDPTDVYRSENAEPDDWIMVGSHDTPPLWALARDWQATGDQAEYLARRLCPDRDHRALERELRADVGALAHAKVADAFASRAQNVMVFFSDLLGLEQRYNTPGTVGDVNWSLRVPPDWAGRYRADVASGRALNLRRVLALALEARGGELASASAGLIARLRA